MLGGAITCLVIAVGIDAEAPTVAPSSTAPLPSTVALTTKARSETGAAAAPEPFIIEAASRDVGDAYRWFGDRLVRRAGTRTMLVTAYSPDERSCAPFADGFTASGYSVWTNGMRLVAADGAVPFGTLLSVPGYGDGDVVPVLDRGGRIKGARLDVLFPTHHEALQWGAQRLEVTEWVYVEDDRPPA